MADTKQEAQWRKQFEENGRDAVLTLCHDGSYQGPQRGAAFRWLRDKERQRDGRDDAAQWYSKWTFCVAVAAAILAFLGIVVSLLH